MVVYKDQDAKDIISYKFLYQFLMELRKIGKRSAGIANEIRSNPEQILHTDIKIRLDKWLIRILCGYMQYQKPIKKYKLFSSNRRDYNRQ